MKKPSHYVNNKQLYAAMVEYKEKVNASKEANTNKPPIPDYIGECLLLIANRLSHKPNFINYSYREEMISDGIENCIAYIDNFDPEKSQNPFAYFTQIIYYAFLRRIQKEKKQLYIKHKSLENSVLFDTLVTHGDDMAGESFNPAYVDLSNDNMNAFVTTFEENLEKKRVKARKRGLEKFIEDDENEDSDGDGHSLGSEE